MTVTERITQIVRLRDDRSRLLAGAAAIALLAGIGGVLIGRTTESGDDVTPQFAVVGDGYEAMVPLQRGTWMFKVTAHAMDGTLFEQRIDLQVKG